MQQFVRYSAASAIALVADMSILFGLTEWAGMYYLLSATIGFSVGAIIAYLFSITWCFTHRSCSNARLEFVIFVIIGVAGLVLNNVLMWSLTDLAGLFYMYSKILTSGAVFMFNFLMRKKLLFTPRLTQQGLET